MRVATAHDAGPATGLFAPGERYPMKTLQLQLRFLIPLLVALVAAALVVLPLLDQLTLRWFSRDLNIRGALVAGALADAIDDAAGSGSTARRATSVSSPSGCARRRTNWCVTAPRFRRR